MIRDNIELISLVKTVNSNFGLKISASEIQKMTKVVDVERETMNIYDFWQDSEMVSNFLNIYDALSISEAGVEKLFSYLGRVTENSKRNKLHPETLEELCFIYIDEK